jgi:four helix bundle protein
MDDAVEHWFNHERLDVYRESIRFVAWSSQLLEGIARPGDIKDQLERSSGSVTLNIAEGNGKFAPKDRCRFFDIAHGSALECAGALDVLVARGKATTTDIRAGKEMLQRTVRMLMGLIKANSTREYEREVESKDQAQP